MAWYDVKCGNCGAICCENCTSDGDIEHCAQTRFENCSSCGCPSSGHYRVEHVDSDEVETSE